jgi:hypothetical protein
MVFGRNPCPRPTVLTVGCLHCTKVSRHMRASRSAIELSFGRHLCNGSGMLGSYYLWTPVNVSIYDRYDVKAAKEADAISSIRYCCLSGSHCRLSSFHMLHSARELGWFCHVVYNYDEYVCCLSPSICALTTPGLQLKPRAPLFARAQRGIPSMQDNAPPNDYQPLL